MNMLFILCKQHQRMIKSQQSFSSNYSYQLCLPPAPRPNQYVQPYSQNGAIEPPSLRQQSMSNLQQSSSLSQQAKVCVGMVRAYWFNTSGKIEYINYGTAFAVSPRLILTCAHNIYNQEIKAVAHQVVFIPNHKGYIMHYTKKYESIKSQYFQFMNLQKGHTFASLPSLNQVCLIALEKEIKSSHFIGVALHDIEKGAKVSIIGFPSKEYSKKVNLQAVSLTRKHLKGKIASIKNWIMDYTMKTKVGMSGSPILYYDKGKDKLVAVGIHTHSGDGETNRGVYLNQFALEKIRQFQERFYLMHQIPKGICFNDRILHPLKNKPVVQQEQGFQSAYTKIQMETIPTVILEYLLQPQFFQNYYQQ